MKVVHLNTLDEDGGAAKAVQRLHSALVAVGTDSSIAVSRKTGDDPRVRRVGEGGALMEARLLASDAAHKALQYAVHADEAFGFDFGLLGPSTAALRTAVQGADVINLHWVRGLISTGQIRALAAVSGAAVVWTLMDLAPFTGGCHYSHGCQKYRDRCGACPRIASGHDYDLSRITWQRRADNLRNLELVVIGGNQWILDRAAESSIMRHARFEKIPLPLDLDIFRPFDQVVARHVLGLPTEPWIIFLAAQKLNQVRKGFAHALDALRAMRAESGETASINGRDVLVVTAGRADPATLQSIPYPHRHLGRLDDDRSLALGYQAADLFLCPSIEDAGPMMVSESLACGIPVVAYDVGSAQEWIANSERGYVATLGDPRDLGHGMVNLLQAANWPAMRQACRSFAEGAFAPSFVAARYHEVYQSLLR